MISTLVLIPLDYQLVLLLLISLNFHLKVTIPLLLRKSIIVDSLIRVDSAEKLLKPWRLALETLNFTWQIMT